MMQEAKKFNFGNMLVTVAGPFAEMSSDMELLVDLIATTLAEKHVSFYTDSAKQVWNYLHYEDVERGRMGTPTLRSARVWDSVAGRERMGTPTLRSARVWGDGVGRERMGTPTLRSARVGW
jgi:hypothetical protein